VCPSGGGKESGRVSLAALVCVTPGERTRLIYRLLVHTGRKGQKKGFHEDDLAHALDAAHHQLDGKLVLLWDNSTAHTDTAMLRLLQARRDWLTVFRLPPYAPELNPPDGLRAG
jgi:hypothetical protein